MVLVSIAAFVAWLLTPFEERTDFRVWLEPWHLLVILALLAVIPLMTYWALKLWLEGDVSKYPDIDRAWHEGLQELARMGVDPTNIPLFLVLGADSESAADRLIAASAQPWVLKSVPEGRAAPALVCQRKGYSACRHGRRFADPGKPVGTGSPRGARPRIGRDTWDAGTGGGRRHLRGQSGNAR